MVNRRRRPRYSQLTLDENDTLAEVDRAIAAPGPSPIMREMDEYDPTADDFEANTDINTAKSAAPKQARQPAQLPAFQSAGGSVREAAIANKDVASADRTGRWLGVLGAFMGASPDAVERVQNSGARVRGEYDARAQRNAQQAEVLHDQARSNAASPESRRARAALAASGVDPAQFGSDWDSLTAEDVDGLMRTLGRQAGTVVQIQERGNQARQTEEVRGANAMDRTEANIGGRQDVADTRVQGAIDVANINQEGANFRHTTPRAGRGGGAGSGAGAGAGASPSGTGAAAQDPNAWKTDDFFRRYYQNSGYPTNGVPSAEWPNGTPTPEGLSQATAAYQVHMRDRVGQRGLAGMLDRPRVSNEAAGDRPLTPAQRLGAESTLANRTNDTQSVLDSVQRTRAAISSLSPEEISVMNESLRLANGDITAAVNRFNGSARARQALLNLSSLIALDRSGRTVTEQEVGRLNGIIGAGQGADPSALISGLQEIEATARGRMQHMSAPLDRATGNTVRITWTTRGGNQRSQDFPADRAEQVMQQLTQAGGNPRRAQ